MKVLSVWCNRLSMKAWGFLGVILLASALPAEAACTLAWNANTESDLSGYRVYHSYSSNGYTVGGYSFNTSSTSVTCDQMRIGLDGQLHYWVVTAYDTAGNESPFSAQVWMQMPLLSSGGTGGTAPPPPAPTCLKFAGNSGNCKRWGQ
jgi:hypothetical protein